VDDRDDRFAASAHRRMIARSSPASAGAGQVRSGQGERRNLVPGLDERQAGHQGGEQLAV
jgi:hypothetical protein